jgi:hypothetical protein
VRLSRLMRSWASGVARAGRLAECFPPSDCDAAREMGLFSSAGPRPRCVVREFAFGELSGGRLPVEYRVVPPQAFSSSGQQGQECGRQSRASASSWASGLVPMWYLYPHNLRSNSRRNSDFVWLPCSDSNQRPTDCQPHKPSTGCTVAKPHELSAAAENRDITGVSCISSLFIVLLCVSAGGYLLGTDHQAEHQVSCPASI